MLLKLLVPTYLVMMTVEGSEKMKCDPTGDQLVLFKNRTWSPNGPPIMTTSSGAPIDCRQVKSTLNKKLIFNEYFMDSLTHMIRERIPERVVHAKAGGAFGYFEVTHDITHICKAKLFNKVGKRTPIAIRFSPVVLEKGAADTTRTLRGFAVKFYTEDGNFDIVGANFPMTANKDPNLFAHFVRSFRKNPATNQYDDNMVWDFLTLNPEVLHLYLLIQGDRGIPDGYRHMPGFSVHTYQVTNKHGTKYFIRFHYSPDAGIKNLSSKKGFELAGTDPDYATKDLYNAIGNRKFPTWTVSIQVLSERDVKHAGFDIFDVTLSLPLDKYPLKPVGRFVLNRNAVNYFAEIEQLAFSPANLVPGIQGGPDKVFEARRLAYKEAQYYRLGGNFYNIPVNCPINDKTRPYNRDGQPPVNDNQKDIPNYYPNSFNGPVPYIEEHYTEVIDIHEDPPNNFAQARETYVNVMTPGERKRAIENILESLRRTTKFLQDRVVKVLRKIHPDLSQRVKDGLQVNQTEKGCNLCNC